jgi:hypothetical protein
MPSSIGYAAPGPNTPLASLKFGRRPVGPEDVLIGEKSPDPGAVVMGKVDSGVETRNVPAL